MLPGETSDLRIVNATTSGINALASTGHMTTHFPKARDPTVSAVPKVIGRATTSKGRGEIEFAGFETAAGVFRT
jgi:hypothetical protein